MMSTAGSIRPPMSNVSATPGPAFEMVRKVCADPAATRLLAVQPEALGGGGGGEVGLVVAGGAVGTGAGRGVTFASPLTTRTHPGSITLGFPASDG